jgi:hypothetical protein
MYVCSAISPSPTIAIFHTFILEVLKKEYGSPAGGGIGLVQEPGWFFYKSLKNLDF